MFTGLSALSGATLGYAVFRSVFKSFICFDSFSFSSSVISMKSFSHAVAAMKRSAGSLCGSSMLLLLMAIECDKCASFTGLRLRASSIHSFGDGTSSILFFSARIRYIFAFNHAGLSYLQHISTSTIYGLRQHRIQLEMEIFE